MPMKIANLAYQLITRYLSAEAAIAVSTIRRRNAWLLLSIIFSLQRFLPPSEYYIIPRRWTNEKKFKQLRAPVSGKLVSIDWFDDCLP